MRRLLLAAPAAALLAACSGPSPAPPAAAPPAKAALGAFGVETANMDTTVKPGDDFFKYANGKWLATYKMPADKARFGAFDALGDKSEADVKTVVESLAAEKPAAGTTAAKVGDMYSSWMDEAAIEARGITPLQPYLDKINAVTDTAGVLALMGTTEFASPFGLGVEADPQDPTKYAIWAGQDGLGMPRPVRNVSQGTVGANVLNSANGIGLIALATSRRLAWGQCPCAIFASRAMTVSADAAAAVSPSSSKIFVTYVLYAARYFSNDASLPR